MIYTSLEQLAERVLKDDKRKKTAAVINADDHHTLEAALHAARDGIVSLLLLGDKPGITAKLRDLDADPQAFEIIHTTAPEQSALEAALAIKDGRADFLMKGLINTNVMLKTLFSEAAGFKVGHHISHLALAQVPRYHKLLGITDVAINMYPTLEHKKLIIENAVRAMSRMGMDPPKVAVLASTEVVNPKMPETVDADALKQMNLRGELTGCTVAGPISFDLAISKESAAIKKIDDPVCGDADLLVVPDISAGNILLKALRYAAGAGSAGIVIGGRAPIVLTSRAVDPQDKYWPLVLAAAASE